MKHTVIAILLALVVSAPFVNAEEDITWTPIQSSAIKAVQYDPGTSALLIQFPDGRIYRYLDVPPELVHEFLGAPSKGQYFISKIKKTYRFEKVAGPTEKAPVKAPVPMP